MKDNSVTYAKAIAIMLVVLGHAYFETPIEWGVNFVHVPLFFFMAGYCFKEHYLNDPITFIKKRVQGLYLPFVKWGLVFLLLHNVFYSLGVYNDSFGYNGIGSAPYSVSDIVTKSIRVLLFQHSERLIGGYWFLPSLFTGSILFYITNKIFKNNILLGGVILLIISMLLNQFNISYYLFNHRNFLAATFIHTGYSYKVSNYQIHKKSWFIVFSLLMCSLGTIFWKSSMVSITTSTLIPYYMTSVCGVLATFGICIKISDAKISKVTNILNFIGNNTISILTWHMTAFLIISLLIVCLYNLDPKRLAEFPVIREYAETYWGFVYFIVSMLICCGITYTNRLASSKLKCLL